MESTVEGTVEETVEETVESTIEETIQCHRLIEDRLEQKAAYKMRRCGDRLSVIESSQSNPHYSLKSFIFY